MKAPQIEATLARIGATAPVSPDLQALGDLQRAFLLAVPFENLDIHRGRPLGFEPADVYRKIVTEHRGGWCYECNGLFRELLTGLGFDVRLLSARMMLRGDGPEFGHMALAVQLDGELYLTDVGNGQSCPVPLRFGADTVVSAEGIDYRLEPQPGGGWALRYRSAGADWAIRFLLTTSPRRPEEFATMSQWQQTSPESIFTQRRIATRMTPSGRVSLTGDELSISDGRFQQRETIADERAYSATLRRHFDIDLPPHGWLTPL